MAIWKNILGRQNSHCKCCKVGEYLACWKSSEEASVDGIESVKRRVRDETREVRERDVFRRL